MSDSCSTHINMYLNNSCLYELHLHGLVAILQSQRLHHNEHRSTPFLLVLLLRAHDSTDVDQIISVKKTLYYIPCTQTRSVNQIAVFPQYVSFYVQVNLFDMKMLCHRLHT